MLDFAKWLLFEEKEQRQIMYHGTSSRNLKSLMSQGLEPFPKNRVWHANSDTGSFENPSKASVGGIYVTTNLLTATGASLKDNKENRLLVVMDIHPYSTVADEDDFVRISKMRIPGILTTDYTLAGIYISWMLNKNPKYKSERDNSDSEEYIEKVKKYFVEESIKTLKYSVGDIHPELEKRLKELLNKEGFEAALQRQAAHIDAGLFRNYCWNYGNWEEGCPFGPPNIKESEQRWAMFMDQITKTFKKIGYPSRKEYNPMQSSRLLKPVRFTGKDKIVCILEILPRVTKENWIGHTPVRIVYGKPPQQLISDWEKFQGEWVVV